MKFKCLVVDDEKLAQDVLEIYITKTADLELEGKCFNVQEANKHIEKGNIDILFLDIKLPGIDGLAYLKSIDPRPLTILTTAFRNHALEAYDLGVIDYLVKPIEYSRFLDASGRAKEFLALKRFATTTIKKENDEFLKIKSKHQYITLPVNDITHVQGLKDYAIIFTPEKRWVIKGSIKHILDMLPVEAFIRVHKSFIVAKKLITGYQNNRIMINELRIPVGRVFKNDLFHYMDSK